MLWTAGVEAPPVAAAIAAATGAKQDRAGRIIVGDDCTIPDHPEIFVTGDMMSLNKLPGVCEVAMQTGHLRRGTHQNTTVARRSAHVAHATSRSATVTWARLPTFPAATRSFRWDALQLRGFLGWVIWLFVHIGFLTGTATASARS